MAMVTTDELVTLDAACERLVVSRPQLFELTTRHGVRFAIVDGRRYLVPAAVERLEDVTAGRIRDAMDAAETKRLQRKIDHGPDSRLFNYVDFIDALWLVLIPVAVALGWLR